MDGVINPDGPTQAKIKEKLAKDEKAGNAFTDFINNRRDMIDMHENMQANGYGYRAAISGKYETA